jgi:hypothetical protein
LWGVGLAVAPRKHPEERNQIVVGREEAVVVEIDVVAGVSRAARPTRKDGKEVDEVLVFGEEGVLVEVDGVAGP